MWQGRVTLSPLHLFIPTGVNMRFWLREVAGWSLVGIGLVVFSLVVYLLAHGHVWQTTTMAVVVVFIFRGGIHLLKMALAARICEQAALALREPPPLSGAPRRGKVSA